MRLETEGGAYVGSVRLDGSHGSLRDLLDDDRAYLALWKATEELSGTEDDFVAVHKGAIRHVVLLGQDAVRHEPAAGA